MSNSFIRTSAGALVVAALLTSCSFAPDYETPRLELPSSWSSDLLRTEGKKGVKPEAKTPAAKKEDAPKAKTEEKKSEAVKEPAKEEKAAEAAPAPVKQISSTWWTDFNDKNLDALVAEALNRNADLQIAAARVAEARAVLSVNRADRYPSIDLQGSGARTNTSENTAQSSRDSEFNDFSLGALFSYELDLWGRISDANDAARARVLSVESNQDAVRLSVAASAATIYFNIVSLTDQIRITDATIKSRQDSYNLRKNLFDGGDIDELVLRQSESELASAKAALPLLEQRRALQLNALNVLLGKSPKEIVEGKLPATFAKRLPKPPSLPSADAADLVIRRPDIAGAEQQLIAANQDVGVARTAYLPRISLSALVGVGADKIDSLFSGGSGLWNAGAAVAGPILNAGRTSGTVDGALARRDQASLNYEQTVRNAYREVLDTLVTNRKTDERYQAQSRQVGALRKSVELAKTRYDAGYSSYIEVLDAERSLFSVELDRGNTELDRLVSVINLYKALGGGVTQE